MLNKEVTRMDRRTVAFVVSAIAGAVLLSASGMAAADTPLTIYNQAWTPANPGAQTLTELLNLPTTLDGQVDDAWQQNSAMACDALKATVEAPREHGGDEYRGYDTVCTMAPSGTLSVGQSGYGADGSPNIPFTYKTHGSAEFTVTQPYFDKWADPRLSVSFDLTIQYMVAVALGTPDGGQPMPAVSLVNASATISNLAVDTQGPIADGVMAAVLIYKGPAFVKSAIDSLNGTRVQAPLAAANLDALNASLADNLGGRRITGAFGIPADNQVVLVVTDPWQASLGNWTVARVTWDKGTVGVNDCDVFGFVSETQTGPAPIVDWDTKELGPAPKYRFPATTTMPTEALGANKEDCQASIPDIPTGAPETVMPTAGVNGGVGQFAGVTATLTPPKQDTIQIPTTYVEFVLQSKIKPGTGVSVVKLKPKLDAGDPGVVSRLAPAPAPDQGLQIDLGKIFGAGQAQTQAPAAAATQTPATGSLKYKYLKGHIDQAPILQTTPQLNSTLH